MAHQFGVSVKFVNDMVKLKRIIGALGAKRNSGFGKLTPHADWVRAQVSAKSDIALDKLVNPIAEERQLPVHSSSIERLLARLELTRKKRYASA